MVWVQIPSREEQKFDKHENVSTKMLWKIRLVLFLLISFICTSIRISYIYRATAHKERISRFPGDFFLNKILLKK
jgi:hypothetical protein